MKLDILAIGAHPDDIELSCGGTLAKCVALGYKAGILDLTQGESGTRGNKTIRAKEATAAAKILGVQVRENLRLPDGQFEVSQANRLKLMTVIRRYRPTFLLIPYSSERHPDHVHAHLLAKEAWFYSGLRKLRTRDKGREQEPWRPRNYFQFMQKYEFAPSFIVDVTDVYKTRMDAIRAHGSQFYDPNSVEPETLLSQKSFMDFIETRAKYYGSEIGVRYGEPFYSVEPVGISDLFSLKLSGG
jgi:N-acetylglucosamine malate deacetylase 1